jgi:CheY-like chemotaxis protein/HPt (histidine-containing phosphotransfer) domain-containing protein
MKPVRNRELLHTILRVMGYEAGEKMVDREKTAAKKTGIREMTVKGNGKKQFHILVAEDNDINRKLAETLVRKKGHMVSSVSNGRKALEALGNETYDLILMDVQMPKMDGVEATLAIRLKENSTCGHVPIIAMTAHAMKGDKEKYLSAGMDEYIAKPIKSNELYNILERFLGANVKEKVMDDTISIDLSQAMDAVDGDKELLKELACEFIEDVPQQLGEIRSVIKKGDAHQLERKAHSFKGAVGNFGAKTAWELAYRLENLGRESRVRGAIGVYNRLEMEMAKFKLFFSNQEWEKNC